MQNKGLGAIGIVLIVVVIILIAGFGGYYGYKAMSSQNKFCCVPQCEELTKTECAKLDGKLTDKKKCLEVPECLLAGGGSQVAGEGYTATAKAEAETDAAQGSGHYTFNFDVYTCDDKIADSQWQGKWTWLWTYTNLAGQAQDPAEAEVSFETDKDGKFTVNIGNSPATGQITKNSIKLDFEMMGVVAKVSAVGSVTSGTAEDKCED